ncbi:MAG TPA: LpqB family beta-propeller domain-containing protein [Herpetosiphonaceae bacterium]
MVRRKLRNAAVMAATALSLVAGLTPASASPWAGRQNFASPRFEEVWRRSDDPQVRAGRSLYWGFGSWFDYNEFYRESPSGLRRVQYFDKARMEINGIGDQSVTNGLLVVELVSGQLKLGNNGYDNAERQPADRVPVAGDPYSTNSSSPTYASFRAVATVNNSYRDADRRDQSVGESIDQAGNKSSRPDLLNAYREQTKLVVYNTTTGHNIPSVFWNFMNRSGNILVRDAAGNYVRSNGPIVDWVGAMGLPITDPYWVRAKVGGVEKDVLVQLFERRILTYTPGNDPQYQVEMGNVGQHYFQWRYPHLGSPWASAEPALKIAFASKRDGGAEWDTYQMDDSGASVTLTGPNHDKETVPYSWRKSWDPKKLELYGDSRRGDGAHRQIWSFDANGAAKRVTYSDGTPVPPGAPYQGYSEHPANDWNPSISPDGTKLAFVSDRVGAKAQIYLSFANGGDPVQLTGDDCWHQTPSWSADGRQLYWESDCGSGKINIYRADLRYDNDAETIYGQDLAVSLTNVVNLTNSTTSNNQFPRVSPDGTKIVFTSNRDGNYEIYVMRADGTGQTRLTNSSADDMAASWKLDGTKLAFDSNRDGNWNVYTMNVDGTGQTQLTNASGDDRWNIWGH